jgi:hypothetical protein
MCLNETYKRVRVGKYLSDIFPIKNSVKHGAVEVFIVLALRLSFRECY